MLTTAQALSSTSINTSLKYNLPNLTLQKLLRDTWTKRKILLLRFQRRKSVFLVSTNFFFFFFFFFFSTLPSHIKTRTFSKKDDVGWGYVDISRCGEEREGEQSEKMCSCEDIHWSKSPR
ncbi:hypothetical protein YC2023_023295 [Brassica napus]